MTNSNNLSTITQIISATLAALQSDKRDELLAALQSTEPAKRHQAVLDILSQSQIESTIAKEVEQALTKLGTYLTSPVWQQYLTHQTTSTQGATLFAAIGNARERRQILRWLIQDYQTTNENIIAVLQAALKDADWEVRLTAVLAVARLQAHELRHLARRIDLPRSGREVLNRTEQSMFRTFRDVAMDLLAGQQPPAETDTPPNTRKTMQTHLLRCIAGLPTKWLDQAFLRILSLTRPVFPLDLPKPPKLPEELIEREGCYYLAQTGLEFVWVPPIPHWLGAEMAEFDQAQSQAAPNPIRQVTPEAGFFIGRWPVTSATVQQIKTGPSKLGIENEQALYNRFALPKGLVGGDYYTCSWPEAQQFCYDLSQRERLPLALPTVDEWEMAARGPDGRRFPWGNGLEDQIDQLASPWGGQAMLGVIGQWTNSVDEVGRPFICGSPDQPHCALRQANNPETSSFGFRLVVKL